MLVSVQFYCAHSLSVIAKVNLRLNSLPSTGLNEIEEWATGLWFGFSKLHKHAIHLIYLLK